MSEIKSSTETKIKRSSSFTLLFVLLLSIVLVQAQTAKETKTIFIDKANMDMAVKPGNDFYEYASGTWMKNNPVPPKETRWGSFVQLHEFNSNALKGILTDVSTKKDPSGFVEKTVGDFYAAGMDSITIEKAGGLDRMSASEW